MNRVEEFICNFKNGFDSNALEYAFTNGNCYHFALILKDIFDGNIIYDLVDGHFMTEIDDDIYDITGEVLPNWDNVKYWDYLKSSDKYTEVVKTINRDCIRLEKIKDAY